MASQRIQQDILEKWREEFEKFISSAPYYKNIERFPDDPLSGWPGSYKRIDVHLSWHAWQEASKQVLDSF